MICRTTMNCYDSRRATRRIWQVLQEFRDSGADEEGDDAEARGDVRNGDGAADVEGEAL